MHPRYRAPLAALLMAAVALSANLLPRRPAEVPAPGPGEAEAEAGRETEAERGNRLDAQRVVLLRSVARCREIRQDLVAGRLTLAEAVAALRAESAARPRHMRIENCFPPDRPLDESWFLNTIAYLRRELEGKPERQAVLPRLEAEWRAWRAWRARPRPGQPSWPVGEPLR